MQLRKISIIGTGQIGTSVVLKAAKKLPASTKIVAVDINPAVKDDLNAALTVAGIDPKRIEFTTNAPRVRDSDIAIFATPVSQFGFAASFVAPYLNKNTVAIDVGSTKERSMEVLQNALPPEVVHIGCHPFNGNAGSGPLTASTALFDGKPLFLVPNPAEPRAEQTARQFWEALDAVVVPMNAAQHDKIVGTMSHLQHAAVFSLMQTDFMQNALTERGLSDPGNWVQGMTRIANSGPEMWAAIFADNRERVLDTARHFRSNLVELSKEIEGGDIDGRIQDAHDFAKDMPSARVKAVDLENERGVDLKLSAFAGLLSVAITENVQRVQRETGQRLAPIANPSLKDGIGPVATDPKSVSALLKTYGKDLQPMVEDYLRQFDVWVKRIEATDSNAVREAVTKAGYDRQALSDVFDPVEAVTRAPEQPGLRKG